MDVRGDSAGLLFTEDHVWRQVAPYVLRIERRNTRVVSLPGLVAAEKGNSVGSTPLSLRVPQSVDLLLP